MANLREFIIYQHLKLLAIKDKDLDQSLRLLQIKFNHPSISNIMKIFDQKPPETKVNLRQLSQQLDESICEEVNEAYKYLSGKNVTPKMDDLLIEIEKFKLECQCLDSIDRETANLSENIVKASNEYYDYIEKHTKNFKLGFKLNYDHATCNLLCAKAQAICYKKRLGDTEEAVHKYGKKEIVDSLKRKRNNLEIENQSLATELEEKKQILDKYSKLDPSLIKEFTALKEELNCRLWAYKMVNRSNCSTGSVGDQSC